MIITVASFKGGVGKTTTAFHLAAYFARRGGPALLIDGDPNRSASGWAKRAPEGILGFRVIDERSAAKYSRDAEHIIIDTQARPTEEDIEALVEACDLLVLPTTLDILGVDALIATVDALRKQNAQKFRILLTRVRGKRAAEEARDALEAVGLPFFAATIPNLVAFETAALLGVPVSGIKGDPAAVRAAATYDALGREIEKRNDSKMRKQNAFTTALIPHKERTSETDKAYQTDKTDVDSTRMAELSTELSTEPSTVSPFALLTTQNTDALAARRIGRPHGKRTNAGYTQITAYIPESLERSVKKKMIDLPRRLSPITGRPLRTELSEIVESLLAGWVAGGLEIQNPGVSGD